MQELNRTESKDDFKRYVLGTLNIQVYNLWAWRIKCSDRKGNTSVAFLLDSSSIKLVSSNDVFVNE